MNSSYTVFNEPNQNSAAVVVLSGGQDSVTCLGLALKNYGTVYALGFRYGQKHAIELEQAALICEKLGVSFVVFDIPALSELGDSALTTGGDVSQPHHRNPNLPASFVPNRNTLFLTIAHAYAQRVQAETVITGVCETDFSGYPDCRARFIQMLEDTLNLGYLTNIEFHTPLMYIDKAATFKLAEDCGILQLVIEESHTCYNGDRTLRWDWGSGCGACPACELRKNGYEKFRSTAY